MEREVKMAAKLYEMRDTAKRLLGDKYTGHMAMNGKILQDTATRDKYSEKHQQGDQPRDLRRCFIRFKA